ncbi:MAG: nicotinate (nicotinamide) nucleotide adenylyltransferase [Solirubrobacteraceae bacterium]|nr:nicotinate (nicotinamide) nucleotide adenylyltransferase [Solirubrobacteraceae bacterium]
MGHLICAQEALEQLGLDRVELLPVAAPPHKPIASDDPGPEVRLELCRAAVAGDDRLGVCEREVRRGGPSFTVDTLRELDAELDQPTPLTFIVGGDMALSLSTWREPQELLRLARLGIAERGEARRAEIEHSLAPLGAADRFAFFAMPRIDISSTDIRARVAAGRRVRHLVPDGVAELIAAEGLYR